MSWMDTVSQFNLVGALYTYAQDVLNGPSHTFLIADCGGHSPRHIEQAIRAEKIDTWGAMLTGTYFMLTVRKADAPRAQFVLDRLGVVSDTEAPRPQEQDAPPPQNDLFGWGW